MQSIPAVYALKDGQIVDGFIGAYPEDVVAAVRRRSAADRGASSEMAALLAAGDEASLRQALELEPGNEDAVVGAGRAARRRGRADEALALLARIPETDRSPARSPPQARLADAARGRPTTTTRSSTSLLDQVKDDDEARQEFVDILELMGPDDPRTAGYRRQLTQRLF